MKLDKPEGSDNVIQRAEWGKYALKNSLCSEAVIQNRRRNKEFPRQTKSKFVTTKLALKEILRGTLSGEKKTKKQKLERTREYHQKCQFYR